MQTGCHVYGMEVLFLLGSTRSNYDLWRENGLSLLSFGICRKMVNVVQRIQVRRVRPYSIPDLAIRVSAPLLFQERLPRGALPKRTIRPHGHWLKSHCLSVWLVVYRRVNARVFMWCPLKPFGPKQHTPISKPRLSIISMLYLTSSKRE